MPWEKGRSGNPAGRPKQDRALAAILAAAGQRRPAAGQPTNNEKAAGLLYELLNTGRLKFGDQVIEASAREWLQAYSFLCRHLDGPYQPASSQEIADSVLDQVLRDLAGDADPTARRAAVAAQLGALVAALLQLDDPMLMTQARELQRELQHEEPDPARLLQLRQYFAGQTGEARRAAAAFFGCDEVKRLIGEAASRG